MEKDSFWFSHDSNASEDEKCILLIDQMGLEGYGIFWVLVEKLRNQADYKLKFKVVPGIAKRYGTSTEKMTTVIKEYELFQYDDDGFFYSESLNKRMEIWEEKKKRRTEIARNAAIKRHEDERNAKALLEHNPSNAQAMLIDTIIEDDRIEQNRTKNNIKKEIKDNKSFSNENEAPPKVKFDELKKLWNNNAEGKEISKVIKISDTRQRNVNAILKEHGQDSITKVLDIVFNSDFLTGNNDRKWKATFDWVFKKENFLKILEGQYNNYKKGKKRFTIENFKD